MKIVLNPYDKLSYSVLTLSTLSVQEIKAFTKRIKWKNVSVLYALMHSDELPRILSNPELKARLQDETFKDSLDDVFENYDQKVDRDQDIKSFIRVINLKGSMGGIRFAQHHYIIMHPREKLIVVRKLEQRRRDLIALVDAIDPFMQDVQHYLDRHVDRLLQQSGEIFMEFMRASGLEVEDITPYRQSIQKNNIGDFISEEIGFNLTGALDTYLRFKEELTRFDQMIQLINDGEVHPLEVKDHEEA